MTASPRVAGFSFQFPATIGLRSLVLVLPSGNGAYAGGGVVYDEVSTVASSPLSMTRYEKRKATHS